MSSGVSVDPACIPIFNELKLRHRYRYIIFSLTDDHTTIRVLATGHPAASYDDFVEELKLADGKRECRYGVFDAAFSLADGSQRNKIVFFLWSPEMARIKQKILYTTSKDYLKRVLVGIRTEVQATDYAELAWTLVMEKLLSTEQA